MGHERAMHNVEWSVQGIRDTGGGGNAAPCVCNLVLHGFNNCACRSQGTVRIHGKECKPVQQGCMIVGQSLANVLMMLAGSSASGQFYPSVLTVRIVSTLVLIALIKFSICLVYDLTTDIWSKGLP